MNDLDREALGDPEEGWFGEPEWLGVEEPCEGCALETAIDECSECGLPLCGNCFETGAGFCVDHPSERYQGGEE